MLNYIWLYIAIGLFTSFILMKGTELKIEVNKVVLFSAILFAIILQVISWPLLLPLLILNGFFSTKNS